MKLQYIIGIVCIIIFVLSGVMCGLLDYYKEETIEQEEPFISIIPEEEEIEEEAPVIIENSGGGAAGGAIVIKDVLSTEEEEEAKLFIEYEKGEDEVIAVEEDFSGEDRDKINENWIEEEYEDLNRIYVENEQGVFEKQRKGWMGSKTDSNPNGYLKVNKLILDGDIFLRFKTKGHGQLFQVSLRSNNNQQIGFTLQKRYPYALWCGKDNPNYAIDMQGTMITTDKTVSSDNYETVEMKIEKNGICEVNIDGRNIWKDSCEIPDATNLSTNLYSIQGFKTVVDIKDIAFHYGWDCEGVNYVKDIELTTNGWIVDVEDP